VAALATSSGHSAPLAINSITSVAGDNFVYNIHLYGGSYNQFRTLLKNIGVEARFAGGVNVASFELIDVGKRQFI
jgi:O-acetylhomoserine (thiol)-lyase